MSPPEILIACIGKPSAGKSSFLNATTNAVAKVGNFPFTTIDPNRGIAFYTVECPCKRLGVVDRCRPRYGSCTNGMRSIPIPVLDVAGLVPGASKGAGLGNRFLDDLRHAKTFIHVVDASGTTDAEGKETVGYDPTRDVAWLVDEIRDWVNTNLHKHWTTFKRKASSGLALEKVLAMYFGGYGADRKLCAHVASVLPAGLVKKPVQDWDDADVLKLVDVFVRERFPMVVALNKIDLPDADKNITSICSKYPDFANDQRLLVMSTLAENFLRKLHQEQYIHYTTGTDQVFTAEDADTASSDLTLPTLKPMEAKMRNRLDKVMDLVLFRYGSTGCKDVVNRAVELAKVVPVYPVRSVHHYGGLRDPAAASGGHGQAAFVDCYLVSESCTVRELAEMLFSYSELERHQLVYETVGGRQLSEDDEVKLNPIIAFKFRGVDD